ncbi:hypothetical protein HZC32_00315, partial [Candidatus Woesearchaeota archaeon]|nr:hypothetical protein [Candidatus Woesearchaeota archaeon]
MDTPLSKTIFGELNELWLDPNEVIYYPLLLDPEIEKESKNNKLIKRENGQAYIKGPSLNNILECFGEIYPRLYQQKKKEVL